MPNLYNDSCWLYLRTLPGNGDDVSMPGMFTVEDVPGFVYAYWDAHCPNNTTDHANYHCHFCSNWSMKVIYND